MTTVVTIPTVETARLRMRAPRLDDFEAHAAFRASARAQAVGGPYPRSTSFDHLAAIVGQWQLRGYGRWLVADRETDAPLGIVGLFHPEDWPEPEIGWSLYDGAEGRGIGFEAAQAARAFAYDSLGWTTVASLIAPDNLRSIALARRLGAEPDGTYTHPAHGLLQIWRHPGPEALR